MPTCSRQMSLPVSCPKFSLVTHLLTGVGHPKRLLLMVPGDAQIEGFWGAVSRLALLMRAIVSTKSTTSLEELLGVLASVRVQLESCLGFFPTGRLRLQGKGKGA